MLHSYCANKLLEGTTLKVLRISYLVIEPVKILSEIGDLLQIPQLCFFPYNLICCCFPQFKANPPAVTFELTGETDNIFKIEQEGLLYYTKALDRETRSTHNLQVN